MKVLITGADGFTGQHLSKYLQAQGHEIIPFSADLTKRESVYKEVDSISPDWVVHLAAISFVDYQDCSSFYTVNVIGTLNLLDALVGLKQQPLNILIASSANVYGNCQNSPISESQPPAPVNHYAASKLAMEHLTKPYIEKLPLFFVRPFNYTGPGQSKSFLIPKLVDHFIRKANSIDLGNLQIEREFNDVNMVCQAYLLLLERAKIGEAYNVCTGITYSLIEVLELLEQETNHKIKIKVNPSLVRKNEVHKLCGDPAKINELDIYLDLPLSDTVSAMLSAES
jgi:nucleoside-diphosphate-sugar epimerase